MRRLLTTLLVFMALNSNAQILRDSIFHIAIYDINVRVIIAADLWNVSTDLDRESLAVTFVDDSGVIVIIYRAPFSTSTVFHEVQHAVNFVCIERGITHDVDNDEPQAYLSGYIGDQVVKIISHKPKQP